MLSDDMCVDNANVDRANGSQKIGRALKIYLRTLKKNFCYESDDYFFYDIKIVVIHLVRPFFE